MAKKAIGQSHDYYALELKQMIQQIRFYNQLIKDVQSQINALMNQLNSPIFSIPGVGQRLGAIILAEIRDIQHFQTPAQLQAFAGLEPSVYQSGQMNLAGKMVKRGSTYLRYAIIQATKICCNLSEHFNAYLTTKRNQGKHYNVAISHTAKKLIRIIFHLLKTNQTFDEAKLR